MKALTRWLFTAFSFFSFIMPAAVSAQTSSKGEPLTRLIKSDGTLRLSPGVSGTFDPAGWRLVIDPDGSPRFIRTTSADTADIHWDNRFIGPSGTDGFVNAVAVVGTDIYFGGLFVGTEKIPASNIVRWIPSSGTWTPLGAGVDGSVMALAVIGTNLYVAGAFSHAGGAAANSIARWDGASWSTLGTSPNDGVNGNVYALVPSATNLFVGGAFTTAGGSAANRIARWDGTGASWSPLGTGLGAEVYALAVAGSDLYAGGIFTTAGGNPARRIARWTGSAWVSLGTSPNDGADSTVFTLAAAAPYLYAGGDFTHVGGTTAANLIARWNGATWSPLGNGFTSGSVRSILVSGGSVYAAGSFTGTGITSANRIAQWDTLSSSWSPLNGGTDGPINAMLINGSSLYAAGEFTSFTNATAPVPANHLALWTGGTWQSLGTSSSNSIDGGPVRAIAVSGNDLYIGGYFTIAASVVANNIVKYNSGTNTWTPLGSGPTSGVDGQVYSIAVSGTDVYVGGTFTHAGGVPANNIAKWSGTSWSALGTSPNDGVEAVVEAIAVSGTNVFVGGGFRTAGGASAVHIARWNGTTWSPLGSGINSSVIALAIVGSDLYAGGAFGSAGGSPANFIARWNGASWSPLGTPPNDGVNNSVFSLTATGSSLYIGGFFTKAGGTLQVNGVAKWDGSAWTPLGNGLSSGSGLAGVFSLALSGGSLYATGTFTSSGILTANYIARWDTAGGGSWNPLGSGLSNGGTTLAVSGGDLFVGGSFTMAGSKPSYKFARWNPSLVTSSVGRTAASPQRFALAQNYPNPFNPSTSITYQLRTESKVSLVVYDILGRRVATLVDEHQTAGQHLAHFDGQGLSSGVYICRLIAGDQRADRKMLLMK